MSRSRILDPGKNCWRIEPARRVSFIVDGADYFRAFREAVKRAECSIFIIGWDIDSRLELVREDVTDGFPTALGPMLNALVERKRGLSVYVLTWDFAMIYAMDREWLPIYKLDWKTHRRVHFRMDDQHPVGASHHQKIVVIDDALAFVGGLDLTKARWDTPEHRPKDPRRVDADGNPERPHHDVQMAVAGEAAAAIAELARERWRRATDRRIPLLDENQDFNPWPEHLEPALENVEVAIARTDPPHGERKETREVEKLYLDAIAAARHRIYIENQYLTSNSVAEALAARLKESDGPEMVVVLPPYSEGWLERRTMDALRFRVIEGLRRADAHGRLHVYYPDMPDGADEAINLHSKLMIVDDEFLRVGSANLNNRSMGLDTECDLALEAGGDKKIAHAIAALRNRLLAEHLGVTKKEFDAAVDQEKSLIAAIERLNTNDRCLKSFDPNDPRTKEEAIADADLVDPERPIAADELMDRFVPKEGRHPARRRMLAWGALVVFLAAMAALWRFTPFGQSLDMQAVAAYFEDLRGTYAAPLVTLLAYVVGGLAVFPVTLLIAATVMVFGSLLGFIYALAGVVLSALLTYALGAGIGRNSVRKLAGERINRLSRKLGERGILTIIAVRVVPIAPFTVVNLVAGASHIRLRDYLLGTLLGMAPGIAAVSLLMDRILASIRQPGAGSYVLLVAVTVAVVVGIVVLRKWLSRSKPKDAA